MLFQCICKHGVQKLMAAPYFVRDPLHVSQRSSVKIFLLAQPILLLIADEAKKGNHALLKLKVLFLYERSAIYCIQSVITTDFLNLQPGNCQSQQVQQHITPHIIGALQFLCRQCGFLSSRIAGFSLYGTLNPQRHVLTLFDTLSLFDTRGHLEQVYFHLHFKNYLIVQKHKYRNCENQNKCHNYNEQFKNENLNCRLAT